MSLSIESTAKTAMLTPTTKRVTMADVAARAGVKTPSVSVVLNGAKSNVHISASARERILQAAQELGYMRNAGMASIASGRFGCVALLLSTDGPKSTLPDGLWKGIYDKLAQSGVHLTMFRLPDEQLTDNQTVPKILREWMADGMLIDYTHNIPPTLISLIEKHTLPAIWINSKQEFDCVRPDDFNAGFMAAEHLLSLGHRKVAYAHLDQDIKGSAYDHYSVSDRYAGYAEAMRHAGLQPRPILARGLSRPEQVQLMLDTLKDPSMRPTALISYAEEAQAAVWAANQIGLRLPEDISLITFNPNAESWSDLTISAYLVPEYQIGWEASSLLQEKIAVPEQRHDTRLLPFVFCEGNSIVPPQN